ncbi:MAG: GNAT family N-acetyltransferase [Anaerolineae bacterium]|nr:GNAT family N-acetyltransferase [Anaerolineae bacterium]
MQANDIRLQGPRVVIRPLCLADLDEMNTWPESDDPRYRLFDWPICSPAQNEIWFDNLIRDPSRVYYAVEDETGRMVGRISLREIREHWSARLGIGFGAPFVGQGYGTEALQVFLKYYFATLGFERMVLDVAAINERAVRCYLRCGFKKTGTTYRGLTVYDDLGFLQNQAFRHLRHFFKLNGRYRRMLYYDMMLEKRDWLVLEATHI